MAVDKELFGKMPDGSSVYLFTLYNSNGAKIQVTNYGAKIVSIFVPDRNGKLENVILGYKYLEHYLNGHSYLGATIGRVANRIGRGQFELDGQLYRLTKNNGENHLHGGDVGFDSLLWNIIENEEQGENPSVSFQLISPDGDQGYPGKLIVTVKYSLRNDNSVKIDFTANSDRPTIVNLTNHAYFNLNPIYCENIYRHKAKFNASNFLESDANLIPTGRTINVDRTPLDFRQFKEIGLEIDKQVEPIISTCGYDQFLVCDSYKSNELNLMAEVEEPISGRVLQVFSTFPGMQFYTSNFLDTKFPTGYGEINSKHSSFCIEPSYFVDAPNHPNFKSIELDKDETYNETIVYKFLTR
ncbi:MAG: galactose mutarotase [Bacteroidales bacterium]|nr:MAG: galactose mutarotase [Bacteroidales bacterium]